MEIQRLHLRVAHPEPGRVRTGIELAADTQAGASGGGGDEVDHGLVGDERLAPPVLRDGAEEAVLDLVPLARAGREVADRDLDTDLVSEPLELELPEPQAGAVASTRVGGGEQAGGGGGGGGTPR